MASQGVVDPQSIVLCTPVPWPYRASMDNAPLDEPRVPAALVLLTELDLPVAPLADRVGHALDLLRDRERTPALALEDRALLQEPLSRRGCRTPSGPRPGAARGVPHPLARARDDLALGTGRTPSRTAERSAWRGWPRCGRAPRGEAAGPRSQLAHTLPGYPRGSSPSSRRILR